MVGIYHLNTVYTYIIIYEIMKSNKIENITNLSECVNYILDNKSGWTQFTDWYMEKHGANRKYANLVWVESWRIITDYFEDNVRQSVAETLIKLEELEEAAKLENDRKIFEVNYFGHVQMTKAILPQMLNRKSGHIVTTSSLTGKWGFYLRSAYAASKHALHGFFDSLRMEVEDSGIRVTLITPGFIATEISKHAIDKSGNPSGEMDNNQAKGISSEECARQILAGIVAGKDEFGVGGKELRGLFLHRYFPKLFKKILKRTAAR